MKSDLQKIERWLEEDLSASTAQTYMGTVKAFDDLYGIENLTESTVADFILEEKADLKSTSKARHLYALKKAEKPLLLYDVIEEIDWEQIPNIEQSFDKQARDLSKEKIETLIEAADKYRDKAMILLGYDLALRVSEMAGLKHEQIDLENRKVYLDRAKGGDKAEWTISQRTAKAIKEFVENGATVGKEELFDIGTRRLNECFRALGEQLGLVKKGDRFGLHILRHSRATHLAGDGWDPESLRQFLGQSSIQSADKYIHAAPEKLEDMKKESDAKMLRG